MASGKKINWREVYVHWTINDFELRTSGSMFAYKGLHNAFKALKQSYDDGKWKGRTPKPLFFDFSGLELLSKNSREDFFNGERSFNEKQMEAEIDKLARSSGKQGWSAKYDASYKETEYVVFNEYIRLDMVVQDSHVLIQEFIKDSYSEIQEWERRLRFIDMDTYLQSLKDSPQVAYAMEDECSEDQREELLMFLHMADHLTKAVRILAYYSALQKKYFHKFLKYVDILERDRLVYFSMFPQVFFQPELRF